MMIGTTNADILGLVYVLVAGVLGIVVGALTHLAMRQKWRVTAALADAVLGALAAVAVTVLDALIDVDSGTNLTLVSCVIVASVVLRHVLMRPRQANSHVPRSR